MNAAMPGSPAHHHSRSTWRSCAPRCTAADPALVQDALYDAEEYLRSELAAQPGRSEAEVIATVAGSYGAPDEVADIYRDTEVHRADRRCARRRRRRASPCSASSSASLVDPRTYGALFYMLLSLATGIFYFTWVVTGLSLSLGLAVLIIGIPFAVLFFGTVRGLSLVEGRLVEVDARRAHAAPAAIRDRSLPLAAADRRHVHRSAHLVDAAVLHADAAAGHRLLHRRGDAAVGVAGLHLARRWQR